MGMLKGVEVKKEEGFVDFCLPISETKIVQNFRHIVARGRFNGKSVGLEIIIPSDMKQGLRFDGEEIKIANTYAAALGSIGMESDEFLNLMGESYGLNISKGFSPNKIFFTILPLETENFDIEKQSINTKIFFEQSQEQYAEMFLNIDLPTGYIELKEKDPEYKKNILANFQNNQLYYP
jgi:hypothetical protein